MRSRALPATLGICLLVLSIAASVSFALPPAISISSESLNNKLTDTDYQQINNRIQYWCNQIVQAKKTEEITEATDRLQSDYGKYSSTIYRVEFAGESVGHIVPTFKKLDPKDPLLEIKEVNLAIAITSMPQLSIQPALNTLIDHKNPSVRYLGWKGYLALRTQVLIRGSDATDPLFAILEKRTKKETAPLVVAKMYSLLHFPETRPASVSETTFREASQKAFGILTASLNSQCILYADGYADAAVPCYKALAALRASARINSGQRDIEDRALQGIVNVAYAAAKAYEKAQKMPSGQGMSVEAITLLREAEDALNDVSKANKSFIQDVLVKEKMPLEEKIPAIALAVLKWVNALKDRGVGAPEFAAPAGPKTSATGE